jgi:hypothetical protein
MLLVIGVIAVVLTVIYPNRLIRAAEKSAGRKASSTNKFIRMYGRQRQKSLANPIIVPSLRIIGIIWGIGWISISVRIIINSLKQLIN